MSRSLLAKRLRELERAGVVERRTLAGRQGHDYVLTEAGRELRPIIEGLGSWGQRWVVAEIDEADLDPSLLMWDIRRNLRRDDLPESQVVIRVDFVDVPGPRRTWWLLANRAGGDLCMTDPGFEVDLTLTVRLRALTRYWLGQIEWRELLGDDRNEVAGPAWARRALPVWLGRSVFAAVPPRG